MSIELTSDQLQTADTSPVQVTDPETRREYVVITKEEYERMQESLYDDSPWTDEEMELLAWEAGKLAGWEEMDEYDHYPERK
jgi:PHD/YefM family antitoxin component YafN of YafNO toxin-antitoxin module